MLREDPPLVREPDYSPIALDDDDFENTFEEPESEPESDEENGEWFGYRAPRRRICLDQTGGRFPGF